MDTSGQPIGDPQPVRAPTPGFATAEPTDARVGKLYAFKVTSTTPRTIRYEVTDGRLPRGLTLNQDTGGITGIPTAPGISKFTITAKNGGAVVDARTTYKVTTRP
ncbi:Ig domain-containing protein [Streptomyces sp. NPDC001933]|uniref:Ig domain-containing protein n=1 Tax=Streptomyces sp. NPDC001933 TaxID=3364626 RepID=UPI0036C1ED11